MLLLDVDNEPTSTVYYLAAAAYTYIRDNDGIDFSESYKSVMKEYVGRDVRYELYNLAIDFLFLLNRISVDSRGGLHVH